MRHEGHESVHVNGCLCVCVCFLCFPTDDFFTTTSLIDFNVKVRIRRWEPILTTRLDIQHSMDSARCNTKCYLFLICTTNPFSSEIQSSKFTNNMSPYHLQGNDWTCNQQLRTTGSRSSPNHSMDMCVCVCVCVCVIECVCVYVCMFVCVCVCVFWHDPCLILGRTNCIFPKWFLGCTI